MSIFSLTATIFSKHSTVSPLLTRAGVWSLISSNLIVNVGSGTTGLLTPPADKIENIYMNLFNFISTPLAPSTY